MIGQAVRHGRTARDARNLGAHLLKDKGARIEIINSAAPDLQSVMSDMQIARDGSRADAAFLHLSLSPGRDMSDDELRQVAAIVTRHFGAEDHPAAFVIHDKDRANDKGNAHGHLVLGRIGPDGQIIESGFEKIRLETAMRIAEFELGEPVTLGRHHASSVKWLRENGRDDVADYMVAAHGQTPAKPMSAASPAKRQGIERQAGTDLATVTGMVRSAWERSDNAQAFCAALAEGGFAIQKGQKDGVFLVMKDGGQIGALDRLLKEKRRDVASRMEDFDHEPETKAERSSDIKARRDDLQKGRAPARASSPAGRARADRGRPDRDHPTAARDDIDQSTSTAFESGRPAQQSGQFERAQALKQLNQIRLSPAAIEAMNELAIVSNRRGSRFESRQAAQEIEASSTGWDRLRELGARLFERCRQTYDQVMAFRDEQQRLQEQLERDRKRDRDQDYHYSGPRM